MVALVVMEATPIIIDREMRSVSCVSRESLPETPNRALEQFIRLKSRPKVNADLWVSLNGGNRAKGYTQMRHCSLVSRWKYGDLDPSDAIWENVPCKTRILVSFCVSLLSCVCLSVCLLSFGPSRSLKRRTYSVLLGHQHSISTQELYVMPALPTAFTSAKLTRAPLYSKSAFRRSLVIVPQNKQDLESRIF
jgi:hypothetical protein